MLIGKDDDGTLSRPYGMLPIVVVPELFGSKEAKLNALIGAFLLVVISGNEQLFC